jgi:hypothetical protein
MSLPSLDAVFFVDQPPEFEYRDGLFHLVTTVGQYRFERVMRPHVFMLALRRAAEAARKHRMGGAVVIPFEREDDSEDAAAAH